MDLREAIIGRIAEIARPGRTWFPREAMLKSTAVLNAWDAAHPAELAELEELEARLDALNSRAASDCRVSHAHSEAIRNGAGRRSMEVASEPRDTQALKAAQDWWMSESWVLVLHGGVGLGKTVAADWVLSQAARDGFRPEFRKVANVVRMSDFDRGPEEMLTLKRASVLVLDDVTTEGLTGRGQGILMEILDARYEAVGTRTVLTSNLSREKLLEWLGQRIFDRFGQGGTRVELKGESLRRTP
jgi:DNA replication protein DnaC